jgi:hypothetical protein
MRVAKTDRGYIDMEHVQAVGEPYYYGQGLYGFDVHLAFRDKPMEMLYYSHDLHVSHDPNDKESTDRVLQELRRQKLEPFVALWRDEKIDA